MSRRSHLLPVILAAVTFIAPLRADDGESKDDKKYTLRYKFKPNQFVHSHVRLKTSRTTQQGDFVDTTTDETATRRHFRVVSVNSKGIATLETTLDHVRMQIKFGEGDPTVFDSDDDASKAGPFLNVWKSIGKPRARFQFTKNGKLLSVTPLRGTAQQGSKDQVEVDAKQNFLIVLPEKPVGVDESWKDDISVKVVLPENRKLQRTIKLRRMYRLEKVEDSIATISLKTIILSRVVAGQIKTQLIQRAPTGTIRFDLDRGIIVARESRVDKVVIGALGTPESSMRATSHRREKIVEPTKVAQNQ